MRWKIKYKRTLAQLYRVKGHNYYYPKIKLWYPTTNMSHHRRYILHYRSSKNEVLANLIKANMVMKSCWWL